MVPVNGEIQLLEEFDRVEILVSAESVRDPLARAPAIVEVQHGGDRIHPQAVDVIHVEPEERAAGEEITDFGAAVIEDGAVPFRVETLARVRVLVQVRTVEVSQ